MVCAGGRGFMWWRILEASARSRERGRGCTMDTKKAPDGAFSNLMAVELDGYVSTFSRTDADGRFHRDYEDLAIADVAGAAGSDDGIDHSIDGLVRHHDFELHLWEKVDGHGFAAAALVDDAALGAAPGNLEEIHPVEAK